MILHITSRDDWEAAQVWGQYHADTLETEGFIHCSTPAQVLIPANALFRGRRDLVLLVIDPHHVDVPIVYEDCYQSGQVFPHIYGALPVEAVVRVVPFRPKEDGSFQLPPGIHD